MSNTLPSPTSLLEHISDGYVTLDFEWRYTYVNSAATRVLGRRADDMIGRVIWDEYPDTIERFGPHFRRAMHERADVEFEEYYAPLDLWTQLRVSPTPTGVGVLFRDITASRRGEAFRERLLSLNAALNASVLPRDVARHVLRLARPSHGTHGGLVALATPGGTHLDIAEHIGYDAAALDAWRTFPVACDTPITHAYRTGQALFLDAEEARRRFADVPFDAATASLVCLPLHAEGGTIGVLAFSFTHALRCDELERVYFTTLAAHCAHALHRARLYERVHFEHARYRALAEATSTAVWTTDAHFRVTEPQPSWVAFTGQAPSETCGMGWLNAVHPDDRDAVCAQLRVGATEERTCTVVGRVRRHDGSYRQLEAQAVPVTGVDGTLSSWIGVLQDVTERHARSAHEQQRRAIIERTTKATDAAELLDGVLREVQQFTRASTVSLALWDDESGEYVRLAMRGRPLGPPARLEGPHAEQLMRVFETREVLMFDASTPGFEWVHALLDVPCRRLYLLRLPSERPTPVLLTLLFEDDAPLGDAPLTLLDSLMGYFGAVVQRAILLQTLARREAHYRSIVEALEEGVIDVNADGVARPMNASAHRLLNLPCGARPLAIDDARWAMTHLDGRPVAPHELPAVRALQGRERVHSQILGQRDDAGETTWWSINAVPVPAHDDASGRAVVTVRDVTTQITLQRRLERQATEDDLTGLANRRAFHAVLDRALADVTTDETSIAVMLLDLDAFKDTNDTHGHHVGDAVLNEIADRLRRHAAPGTFIARISGDEFGLLLPAPSRARATEAAQDLLRVIRAPIRALGYEVHVTASVGVTYAPHDGRTTPELLKNADLAVQRAKSSGRDTVSMFDVDLARAQDRRHALVSHLRRALAHEELHLAYQPIVRLDDASLASVEALARWSDAELGVIGPGEFIPVAEESGLILPLGEWALGAAARQGAAWLHHEGRAVPVAVNVSSLQFQRADFVASVQGALSRAALPPGLLELEITESAVMHDFERARTVLHELRALGVRVALDDFGTGHSSLATLHALPFDKLKLDRAFVWGMEGDARRLELVRAILSLARALHLEVVAEGIETQAQHRLLRDLGCTLGQGYLFARPMPPTEALRSRG